MTGYIEVFSQIPFCKFNSLFELQGNSEHELAESGRVDNNMELKEARDLAIAAIILAFVFTYKGFDKLDVTLNMLPFGLAAVSLSFILHEMAHRYFAKKYGHHAEFQLWPIGLAIALLLTISTNGTFAFAAPGAVVIFQRADLWGNVKYMSRKQMGIVGISGSVVNMILALGFTAAAILTKIDLLFTGTIINIWLALFNMLPIGILDGFKVFHWNKKIWATFFGICIASFIAALILL